MITLSFVLLGFSVLLLQQAWQACASEWDEWTRILSKGLYGSFPGRYRPHPVFRVVSRH